MRAATVKRVVRWWLLARQQKKSLHDIDLHVAIFRLIIYSRNIYAGMSKFIFILKTWNMDGGPRKKNRTNKTEIKQSCVYI